MSESDLSPPLARLPLLPIEGSEWVSVLEFSRTEQQSFTPPTPVGAGWGALAVVYFLNQRSNGEPAPTAEGSLLIAWPGIK